MNTPYILQAVDNTIARLKKAARDECRNTRTQKYGKASIAFSYGQHIDFRKLSVIASVDKISDITHYEYYMNEKNILEEHFVSMVLSGVTTYKESSLARKIVKESKFIRHMTQARFNRLLKNKQSSKIDSGDTAYVSNENGYYYLIVLLDDSKPKASTIVMRYKNVNDYGKPDKIYERMPWTSAVKTAMEAF